MTLKDSSKSSQDCHKSLYEQGDHSCPFAWDNSSICLAIMNSALFLKHFLFLTQTVNYMVTL
jgi:hypothetical protein